MSLLFEEKRKLAKWEPIVVHLGFILPILTCFAIGLFYGPDIIDYVLYCMCNMVHMAIVCSAVGIILWCAFEPAAHNAYYYLIRWITGLFVDLDGYNKDPDLIVRHNYANQERQAMSATMAIPMAVTTTKYQSRCLYCHTSATKKNNHCESCGAAL